MIYFSSQFLSPKKMFIVEAFRKSGQMCKILKEDETPSIKPSDMIVSWNRPHRNETLLKSFEKCGAKVLILENAFMKHPDKITLSFGFKYHNHPDYAIDCLDQGERFEDLGLEIKPWKQEGKYILVTSQSKTFDIQGFGHYNSAQPQGWDSNILTYITRMSKNKIIFRTHPNAKFPAKYRHKVSQYGTYFSSGADKPITSDLSNALCLVCHTSNSAIEALIEGIPVVFTGNYMLSQDCGVKGINGIKRLNRPDNRLETLRKISWNQVYLEEIENGSFIELITRFYKYT